MAAEDCNWYIAEGADLFMNDCKIGKIQLLQSGLKFGQIVVVLENKNELTLAISEFNTKLYPQMEAKCKGSRSLFLNWVEKHFPEIKTVRKHVASHCENTEAEGNTLEESQQENNSTLDYQPDIDDQQETADHESDQHLETKDNEECDNSDEQDDIKKKCIGKQVIIPLENLIEPDLKRRVRDLNLNHVKDLENQFQDCDSLFTVLVGNTTSSLELDQLQKPGNPVIEVIGGNHTRQSLQNILMKGQTRINTVRMDLYRQLTETQALMVGMLHNKQHEHSKVTSFFDTVKLFRKMFKKAEEIYPNSDRKRAMLWRSQVSFIVGVEKDKMKNQYSAHLHCASVKDSVWVALEEFASAWADKKIIGQPNVSLKQCHLTQWIKIKDTDEKEKILRKAASGMLSFRKLKECFSLRKSDKDENILETNIEATNQIQQEERENTSKQTEDDPVQTNASQQRLKNKNQSENLTDVPYKKKFLEAKKQIEELEKNLAITEKDLRISKECMATWEHALKEENSNLRTKMEEMKKISDNREETNKSLLNQIKQMQTQIEDLTKSLSFAENVAARARKMEHEKGNQAEDGARKRKSTDVAEDVLAKKKKETDNVEDGAGKRKSTDGAEEMLAKKKKEKDNVAYIKEDVTIVVVEYTGRKLYLATLEDGLLTYCSRPIGHFENGMFIENANEHSYRINPKDKQNYDEHYVITQLKGTSSGRKLDIVKGSDDWQRIIDQIDLYIAK